MKTSLADRVLPKRLNDEIERILIAHNQMRADPKKGIASIETRSDRRQVIRLAFAQLWEMGNRVQRVKALGDRHVRLLVGRWDKEGVSATTLRTRLSFLSTFSGWIGKPGMVKAPTDYCEKERVRRTTATQVNKSWEANGVDPDEIIAKALELDERLALYLTLQRVFSLRAKESMELRPLHCVVDSGRILEVFEGTKGGKRRSIEIDTEAKRQAIAWATDVAKRTRNGRLRWPNKTFKQAQAYLYALVRRNLGISRKDVGVTLHGLRHGGLQGEYRRETGLPTPIEGGAAGLIDRETHHAASLKVSRVAGHARPEACGSYYGTYGHGLRNVKITVLPMTYSITPLVPFA